MVYKMCSSKIYKMQPAETMPTKSINTTSNNSIYSVIFVKGYIRTEIEIKLLLLIPIEIKEIIYKFWNSGIM